MTITLRSRDARHTERLWTAPDGTICLLSTCQEPPMYSISLVRGNEVLRERRLYGRASADMLAHGWSESSEQFSNEPPTAPAPARETGQSRTGVVRRFPG